MTREEAVQQLEGAEMMLMNREFNTFNLAVIMAISALREQEERRWIPVTERLPEDDLPKDSNVKQIKVLVAYKTNGRWVERTQIRVKGYWYREPDKWSCVKTSDPISHWMPLPEPPKEDAK